MARSIVERTGGEHGIAAPPAIEHPGVGLLTLGAEVQLDEGGQQRLRDDLAIELDDDGTARLGRFRLAAAPRPLRTSLG